MASGKRSLSLPSLARTLPERVSTYLINIETGLPVYVFFATAFIDAGFYQMCALSFSQPTFGSVIFLYKVTGEQPFPSWGLFLPFLVALISAFFTHSSLKVAAFPYRQVRAGAGHVITTLLVFSFLPFSSLVVIAHVAIAGVAVVAVSIQTLLGSHVGRSWNKNSIRLVHSRLLTLVTQAFWATVTIVAGTEFWAISYYQAQNMFSALQQGWVAYTTLISLIVLLGMGGYAMFPLYFEMMEMENRMNDA